MATYSKSSPYFDTKNYGNFLDIMQMRNFRKMASDVRYQIDRIYQYRPDLLAYDLYGDAGLWWVFAVRNPNTIKDPVFDFRPGVAIFIPKKETLIADLGL
jgi:alpha-L-fucosidase